MNKMSAHDDLGSLRGAQLENYLHKCVQLAQEQKFTIKNAFDIKLIDHLIAKCKEPVKDDDETNFSLASMSLQASAKLYGVRVDSVHLDVTRFASGLHPSDPLGRLKRPTATNGDSEPAFDESRLVKRRRVLNSYLAEDEAIEKPFALDLDICRNPILDTVHREYSNPLGRLMSHNLIPLETEAIDLEGISHWWSPYCLERMQMNHCISIKEKLPLLIENCQLNFDVPYTPMVKAEEREAEESFVFDPEADPLPEPEDIPPVNFDDSESMNSDNVAPMDSEDVAPMGTDDVETSELSEDQFDRPRLDVPGDFSCVYNNKFKSTGLNFAGPPKFRLKRYDILGAEKGAGRKKQRQDPKFLSFKDFPEGLADHEVDDSQYTELSAATMDKWTGEPYTLKVDFAPPSFASLAELFTFPGRPLPKDEPDADAAAEEAVGTSEFEDLGGVTDNISRDGEFVYSGLGDDRSQTTVPDGMELEFEVPMSEYTEDLRYDNLLSAPGIVVERDSVSFRRTAAKLDVEQMMDSFWGVLSGFKRSQKMSTSKSFRNLYRDAAPSLSADNKRNMTLPVAFVATLSLCNTKHLELTPEEDSADFRISQAPRPQPSNETNITTNGLKSRKRAA